MSLIFQLADAEEDSISNKISNTTDVVEYGAEFFSRYQPSTALDMVRQLPGFQLDDGDGSRGFSNSAGNLLINGRRLSTKQDLPSESLARIPASLVEKIELIRSQVESIDLQGHSALANVFLLSDMPASVRWELWVLHNNRAPLKPAANASISNQLGDINYNIGIDVERDTSGWNSIESVVNSEGVLSEIGPDDRTEKGFRINSMLLNASSWLGNNFVQLNTRATGNNSKYIFPASSVSQLPGGSTRDDFVETDTKNRKYEVGVDIERNLTSTFSGKAIFLFANSERSDDSFQRITDSFLGQTLLRTADTSTTEEEVISRFELDWSGINDHAVQLNVERAFNMLERTLIQTDDKGSGPFEVNVPGANSSVKEVRWDFLLQDTWTIQDFKMEYGFGAEASKLSQTGDAVQARNFFFFKPHVILNYSSDNSEQTRLRLAREISQLNLSDFVSATLFEDNDLALGNPNITPDTIWMLDLSFEKRFGRESVIKIIAFHHWIKDVLDLLPLSSSFEAPGNIGDGKRWGIEFESTFPLEWARLTNARIDINLLWQDSSVTDPVTLESRRLSGIAWQGGYQTLTTRNENIKYYIRANFRQDFDAERFAWGWTLAERGSRPRFKVNELDIHNDGVAINAFLESTRWFNVKTRILIENLLDFNRSRERIIFTGERDLTPIHSIITNNRHGGRRITLSLSSTF